MECGFVGERTAEDKGLGPNTSSTDIDSGGKTATVMNVSTSRELMILSKVAWELSGSREGAGRTVGKRVASCKDDAERW